MRNSSNSPCINQRLKCECYVDKMVLMGAESFLYFFINIITVASLWLSESGEICGIKVFINLEFKEKLKQGIMTYNPLLYLVILFSY